jgi:hypothetical protein
MKFIGNCSDIIDWNAAIREIESNAPMPANNNPLLENDSLTIKEIESIAKIKTYEMGEKYAASEQGKRQPHELENIKTRSKNLFDSWDNAGYKFFQIQWDDFFSPAFNQEISDKFSQFVRAVPIRVWITRLRPGVVAPRHTDIVPDTYEYLKLGTPVRYICFVHQGIAGHTISFDDITFYNEPVGDVWLWTTPSAMHSAANSSLTPYYLFHFEGYIPHK